MSRSAAVTVKVLSHGRWAESICPDAQGAENRPARLSLVVDNQRAMRLFPGMKCQGRGKQTVLASEAMLRKWSQIAGSEARFISALRYPGSGMFQTDCRRTATLSFRIRSGFACICYSEMLFSACRPVFQPAFRPFQIDRNPGNPGEQPDYFVKRPQIAQKLTLVWRILWHC